MYRDLIRKASKNGLIYSNRVLNDHFSARVISIDPKKLKKYTRRLVLGKPLEKSLIIVQFIIEDPILVLHNEQALCFDSRKSYLGEEGRLSQLISASGVDTIVSKTFYSKHDMKVYLNSLH